MKADEILTCAADLVGGQRNEQHGEKTKNHENIAALWNAYLGIRHEPGSPLSALDVAQMMVLLKLARTQLGKHNTDNWIDMAGYSGVAGEIAVKAALAP